MEITYQRNLHKSYMCIEASEGMIEEHELMMLKEYKISGLLPMQVMIQDGKICYWYDITGKQQLADYLGGKPMKIDPMKKILFSLERLCQRLPEFLLKEDRLCLNMEMVYVDLADETIDFTYLPFRKEEFPKEFRHWIEEVLKKIDHQDRACTQLVYDIYEKTLKENVSIRELLEESVESRKNAWDVEPTWKSKIEEHSERREIEQKKPEKKSIKGIIEEKIVDLKKEIEEKLEDMMPKFLGGFLKSTEKKQEKGKADRKRVEQPMDSQSEEISYHTELLCASSEKPIGHLVYQGRNCCSDFRIEEEKFLIGRNSAQVDGKIETDGISRVHARITRSDGDYYIEDLNSTNGTYLNGELLEYHQSRKLNQNDRVRFGIEEYVFY